MNRRLLLVALSFALSSAGCTGEPPTPTDSPSDAPRAHGDHADAALHDAIATPPPAALRAGVVKERLEAASYVYVLMATDEGDVWIAAPATGVEVGSRVETPRGTRMADFASKALDRTFDAVWFVEFVRPEGSAPAAPSAAPSAGNPHGALAGRQAALGAMAGGQPPHGAKPALEPSQVEPLPDGLTVAAVFTQPAGTEVAVRGLVVKVNRGILGFDWVHLQDGTGVPESKTHDLLVLTPIGAAVEPGQVATARGRIATDKDFGSGYAYALLVEDATVVAGGDGA